MPPTPDQRIRAGLALLKKAGRRSVKAAIQLQRLLGDPHPPSVSATLKWHGFVVQTKRYQGRMTQEQYDYLATQTGGTLENFADAIATVAFCLNDAVLSSLADLQKGLSACGLAPALPAGAKDSSRVTVLDTSTPGCCSYDTNKTKGGVAKAFCDGLLGDWVEGDCGKQPLKT